MSAEKTTKPSISIIVSFRNEEEVLPKLIARLENVLIKEKEMENIKEFEIIFVNDDSHDHSEEILIRESSIKSHIKVINMSRNFGVSPCVLAGMEYSTGDLVVYIDADLQDPPEIIHEMLAAWMAGENIDVVNTKRLSRAGESRIKLLITRLGYLILRKMATIDLQIEVGDFKLLSRRAVNQLIQLREYNPYLRGLVSWIGFNQVTIPYHREARFSGDTKFPVIGKRVINNFFTSALISFSSVPLQISSLVGFIVSLGAFILLIYVFVEKLLGNNVPGWSGIMITVLFIGGMEMVVIGIMGLYINSIFIESKRRPNYIVKSTYGLDGLNKGVHRDG
jgi:dolichol-phosphate mannosyltransferase